MKTATTLFILTLLTAAGVHGQDNAAKEQKRFQGTWTFLSVELEGKNLDDLFKDAKAVVKGDRVTVTFGKGGMLVRTFKLYPDTQPRSVDFHNDQAKGEASEGIYEFKNKRLRLLVNIRNGARERPTTFADKGKSGHIYYVLKRQE